MNGPGQARDDEHQSVELNLEETGILCHLMMRDESFRKSVLQGRSRDPITKRMITLYGKLAEANDKLMRRK